jgi:hypothetical protein
VKQPSNDRYGPDERFASERAELNFNFATEALMVITGASKEDTEHVIHAVTAYIMRDYADRAKASRPDRQRHQAGRI